MSAELGPDLDRSMRSRFGTPRDDARVMRTAAALEINGIKVLRAADDAEAKRIVLGLIPDGSQVHHGASQSLEKLGIVEEIEKSGRYEPVRPRIWSMDRKTQADEIRRLSSAPDVMLGSVHAVTETGSLITASASGSQLGPYVQQGPHHQPRDHAGPHHCRLCRRGPRLLAQWGQPEECVDRAWVSGSSG